MNLRAFNLKWALAFAGAVVVGAVGVVLVLALMGGETDGRAAAQPAATPTPMPLATHAADAAATVVTANPVEPTTTSMTPGPTRQEPSSHAVVIPTVPPGFAFPERASCPDQWGMISDDMANYSVCVPPGWGVPDPSNGEAAVDVVLHYDWAYIYNPEAFPRPVGKAADRPVDEDADFLTIVLFPVRSDMTIGGGCQAEPGGILAGLPAAVCEYKFDRVPSLDDIIPGPSGAWTAQYAFVPLPGATPPVGLGGQPLPTPEGGSFLTGLAISVSGRNEVMDRYQDVVSQILATLEVIP